MSFKAITSTSFNSEISPISSSTDLRSNNNNNNTNRITSAVESIQSASSFFLPESVASSIHQFSPFQNASNSASNSSSSTLARTILKAKRRACLKPNLTPHFTDSRSIFRVNNPAASVSLISSSLSANSLPISRVNSMSGSVSTDYPSFSTEASRFPSSTAFSSSVNSTISAASSIREFSTSSSSSSISSSAYQYPYSQSSSSVSVPGPILSFLNEITPLLDLAATFSHLFENRNYEGAIAAFNLLEQKINSSRSFYISASLFHKAGMCYLMQSNGIKAFQLLTKASRMDPTNSSFKNAVTITTDIFFPMTYQEFFTMTSEFNSYFENSNYPKAIESFEKLIQQLLKVNPLSAQDSTNSSLISLLRKASLCYTYQTDYSKALHYLRSCSVFEGSPSVETKIQLATTLNMLASTGSPSNRECCNEFLEAHLLLLSLPDSVRQTQLIEDFYQINRLKLIAALINALLSGTRTI